MMGDTGKPGSPRPETDPEILDEALEETFPASDPPAVVLPREREPEDSAAEQNPKQPSD